MPLKRMAPSAPGARGCRAPFTSRRVKRERSPAERARVICHSPAALGAYQPSYPAGDRARPRSGEVKRYRARGRAGARVNPSGVNSTPRSLAAV